MNRKLLLLLYLFVSYFSFSQYNKYAVFLIPDSLTLNANSVVRKNILEVTVKAQNKLNIKKNRVITILNEKGNKNLDLYEFYDDDSKILSLSGIILDAQGNTIKKISKNKFTDVSAVSGGTLYSDNRVKFFEYTPVKYPYTVIFESETENSSTGFIPKWYPIYNYSTAIEESVYKFNNPANIGFRKKENNLKDFNIVDLSSEKSLHYVLKNEKAKSYEASSLAYFNIAPSVYVALNHFALKNVKGSADDWKEFGQWMYDKLIKGRDQLDESTKSKIRSLVKEAKTDKEKAKIVYDFVQEKTRYVGVQIGIGGWSPIPANEVDKVGYGDCKGLTNYTKALLDAVGVESYQTIVYAKRKRDLDKNFTCLEGNHMMLNIPNGGDDLWLECTSQIHPFGFLGDFTDDRDVLVITPEGGVMKRTPAYLNEDNLQETKADIVFTSEGSLKANVHIVTKGIQYDNKFSIENESKDDQIKYYKTDYWSYNNNLEVTSIAFNNDEDNVVFTEDLSVEIADYASIVNDEFIFRLNVFNPYSHIPKRYRNRKNAFEIPRGFLDKDSFTIKIPEKYQLGDLPENLNVETKFGAYKVEFKKVDENTISYNKYFLLKNGTYTKEEYAAYRSFLKKVSKYESLKIALQKK